MQPTSSSNSFLTGYNIDMNALNIEGVAKEIFRLVKELLYIVMRDNTRDMTLAF